MRHKVRHSAWINNVLVHNEEQFTTLELALAYAKILTHGIVKIYDELDELIHSWEHGNEHHEEECYA